jgi:hypothetical protein
MTRIDKKWSLGVSVAFVCAAILLVTPEAYSNVSRIERDSSFSGSVRPESTRGLVLRGERMDIRFPALTTEYASLSQGVEVTITYFVEQKGASASETGLQFLAVGATGCTAWVNGKTVPVQLVRDRAAEKEFIRKITEHRFAWNPESYRHYLDQLEQFGSTGAGSGTTPTRGSLASFLRAADNVDSVRRLFHGAKEFGVLAFRAHFVPGANTITVRYTQGLYLDGRTAYFGGPVYKAGFDYLLYPALSWELDPAFELSITVTLPDIREKGWLYDAWYAPEATSNVLLGASYDESRRSTTLHGRFPGFPSDVLTMLFAKGAKR